MPTVFFATNRVLTGPADRPGSYSATIQPPSQFGDMIYGTAFVDSVNVAANNAGTISRIENTNTGSFGDNVTGDLTNAGRNLLVFIHGFANTFTDGITRAAFNRDWMAQSGIPAADCTVLAFSWPSRGQLFSLPIPQLAYLQDQHMASASGLHLMTFLSRIEPILLAARANNCRTFLLAHSMGNLALESAVENWFLHGNGSAALFDLAILAAGDCRFNCFNAPEPARMSGLKRLSERISIYYSHDDNVLHLSQVVNAGAQRLGQDGPFHRADATLFPPGRFRMFDASDCHDYPFDVMTSHQYYRLSPLVRGEIAADMGGPVA
ncbi:MAG: alpha/beta hydrolase [Acetobacteraceae bacterium]